MSEELKLPPSINTPKFRILTEYLTLDERHALARHIDAHVLQVVEADRASRPEAESEMPAPPAAAAVQWVVNDMGELGVRIAGRCYFCYKGDSLVYEDGTHDNGTPILHRLVGKAEFGETVWPLAWIKAGRRQDRYTVALTYIPGLSFGRPDDPDFLWSPIAPAPRGDA